MLLMLCCSNFIFGQATNINKGYAFYKAYLPGMQKVDQNNNPIKPQVTLERIIYLECKVGTKLTVVQVSYNSILSKPIEVTRATNKVIVGVNPTTGSAITIKSKKGYSFWMVALEPTYKKEENFGKNLRTIVIKTLAGTKANNYLLTAEAELTAPEMM